MLEQPKHSLSKTAAYITPEQFYKNVRPGDVLAFSGNDLPSEVVKVATQSEFVHVAIVFSNQYQTEHETRQIMLVESHINCDFPSQLGQEKILGVQFQTLANRIHPLGSALNFWWAPLKEALSNTAQTKMQAWLTEAEQEKIPYDFCQAIGAGMDALDPLGMENKADFSALFCSELVTKALQIAEQVSKSVNPSEQTPHDVMGFDCFDSVYDIRV